MTITFWSLCGIVAFTVAGYGSVMVALASLMPRRIRRRAQSRPLDVTVFIVARNEERHIGAKIESVIAQDVVPHRLSVLVISDGSTDRTVDIAASFDQHSVAVLEVPGGRGKIAALNVGLEWISGDVVVFSDANSELAPGALAALLRHFADPRVGGVCGALQISAKRSGWLGAAENLYWRYDNALKKAESALGGAVSAQGSLYAIRQEHVAPLPLSVADDFVMSTRVVAAGKILVFEPAAIAVELVSDSTQGEFYRRVRSTERGWRGLLLMRGLLNPMRYNLYALQLLVHKVLRRVVPFLLLALFLLTGAMVQEHAAYAALFVLQCAIYGIVFLAAIVPSVRRLPGLSFVFFFVAAQLAVALGLLRVACGVHSRAWEPVRQGNTATPKVS